MNKLLQKGKLQEAIDSIDTNVEYEEAAKKLIFKAQLYIANFQFDEAEAHYKQAADIFPSYENYGTAGNFFYRLNRFKEAEDYYARSLKQATSPEERAGVLNNLGNVQCYLNEHAQAEASYTEALKIYRELAGKNPQAYLPDVATTLVNLSLFYKDDTPNKKKSLQYAKEAIEVLNRCNDTPWVQELRKGALKVIDYWKGKI
ncbi:hypothetical protein FACS1894181_05540 [Bacteroidia bacterium]|nr:hypothetical protein FACS1894181_05540 [Bacteroidia bacterium]